MRQPQHARRRRPGDDGDLVKRVLAVQVLEHRALQHTRMDALQHFLAVGAVHQQLHDLGIGQERAAVGVVGAHGDAPRVLDEQIPLQPDRPLQGVDEALCPCR